ncbi:type II secretory pathway pseudopilin PulG [Streptococcus gallinaceus]|uniref:type II secretion system protein n=1 Tax=Streptococcus gallinaceus TaxID=165758 RepID=UPI00209F29E0|nr:type II secretion system protein [Streptococcus gallinaceus]MCP1638537.1 type II secretory pathway pseudopilin PulG [Streptococcus gallinaceus]MCP1769376.1 type II secretory pathway pseudopilin PulG [Streptococcus gallinaceus]
MKNVKKRKGITLAEVIISLILISVIVVGTMSFFSNSFNNVFGLRTQNKVNFDIQEQFESRIADVKKNGGTGTEEREFVYKIGSNAPQTVKVKGTNLSYKNDKAPKKIHLFVANNKESVLKIPEDLKVTLDEKQGSKGKAYYYVGDETPDGRVQLTDKSTSSKIYTEEGWFQSHSSIKDKDNPSKPIVLVGSLAAIGSTESKVAHPKMLEDFKQISKKNSGFKIEKEMRGSYLTFAARAINSFGRVGQYQEAEYRIWVMGIPVTKELAFHTDADLAVKKNEDGTPSAITTDSKEHQGVELLNYHNGQKITDNVAVKSIFDEEKHQARQVLALEHNTLAIKDIKVQKGTTNSFLLTKESQSGALVSYQFGNQLIWKLDIGDNGELKIATSDASNGNLSSNSTVTQKLVKDQDNSIQIVSQPVNDSQLKVEVYLNGEKIHTDTLTVKNRNRNGQQPITVTFGGQTHINEIAVFERSLGQDEIKSMTEYFKNKYEVKKEN